MIEKQILIIKETENCLKKVEKIIQKRQLFPPLFF